MTDPGTLEAALQTWSLHPGPASTAGVYAALLDADLLLPVHAAVVLQEPATRTGLAAEKESDLAVMTVQLEGARQVLPAFTSTASMRRWRIEARPVQVPVRDACRAALEEGWTGLLLDPGTLDFVVGPSATRALAEGFVPVAGEESVSVGALDGVDLVPAEPAVGSPELLAALRRALAREPAVAAAWLLATRPGLEIGLTLRVPVDPAGLSMITRRLADRLAPDGVAGTGRLSVAALDPVTAKAAASRAHQLWP
jgi:SseB protein N-terminal domain